VGSVHQSRPSRDIERNGYTGQSQGQGQGLPNLSAATNEMVVPNKSRMREEDIEVPYARESRLMDTRRSSRAESTSRTSLRFDEDKRNSRGSTNQVTTPMERRREDAISPVATEDKDYYDRMSFSSQVTSRSKANGAQATGWDDEREQKIRAEYEFRIAGLERRAAVAESERDEARKAEALEKEKRKEWEDESRGLKEVSWFGKVGIDD
jgi:hypothetical protein